MIAEHLEAAGDLHAAFEWHMRAGEWSNIRDNTAAAKSWTRAQHVADRMPDGDPDRTAYRIAPRTLLCATGFRVRGSGLAAGFDELRDLCLAADDQRSLAIAMTGPVMDLFFNSHRREASARATEQVELLESIGDPTLTLGLIFAATAVKHEVGEINEVLRLSQRAIDLAGGDVTKGIKLATSSPLTLAIAFRGFARWCLGVPGWQEDCERAATMARTTEPITRGAVMYYTRAIAYLQGVRRPSEASVAEMAEILALAEQSGDDNALWQARSNLGFALVQRDETSRAEGFELLAHVRESSFRRVYSGTELPLIDAAVARDLLERADFGRAAELSRVVAAEEIDGGGALWAPVATSILVEALLKLGADGDIAEAQHAIDRLAAMPTDPGFVIPDIWLLRMRALLAQTLGDEATYRDYRDRYRKMADDLGFEGHMAWAEAMP